jgi:hypothetical protein
MRSSGDTKVIDDILSTNLVVASWIYGLKCRGRNGKLKDSLNRNVREAQPCDPTLLGYGNTNDLGHRKSTKRAPFFLRA